MDTNNKDTAQQSGDPTVVAEKTTEQGTETTSKPSYFDSQESLKAKITELSKVSESGTLAEIAKASEELGEIEKFLSSPKPEKPTEQSQKPAEEKSGTAESTDTKPKKTEPFKIWHNGKPFERDDGDGLFGLGSTGKVKATLFRTELLLKDAEDRGKDLERRLADAEARLKATPAQQQQAAPSAEVKPVVQPKPVVQRPVPPPLPKLSTNDPSVYNDADIAAVTEYNNKVADFQAKLVEYADHLASKAPQIDPAFQKRIDELEAKVKKSDELVAATEAERKAEAERKEDEAHWKRFSDFQDKHPTLKLPLPTKQMNEAMVSWMSRIATANGVTDGSSKAVVEKYLDGDPTVLKNSEGITPPEGYDKYFKILEIYGARKQFIEEGVLTEKATLEDAYVLHKVRTGTLDEDIASVRAAERSAAATSFSKNIQELQEQSHGIDPSKSSGGPDLNGLGISDADLKWFMSVNIEDLPVLKRKKPDDYSKWNTIAERIKSKAVR